IEIKPIQYPQPRIRRAVYAVNTKDEEKLTDSLKKIHSQDPTVLISFSNETRQLILACQGELHLATIDWTLKNIYGVEAIFDTPKLSFRESLLPSSAGNYRDKQQSGRSGQCAQVYMKFEPWIEGMDEPEGFNRRGKEDIDLP